MASNAKQREPKRSRDIRVDRIGFVQELEGQYIDGTKEKPGIKPVVKATMIVGDVLEGDFFEATLTGASTSSVPPAFVLGLLAKKKLTRAQALACLATRTGELTKAIGEAEVKKVATVEPGTPRFSVKRKEGVNVELKAALVGLSGAIHGDAARAVAAAA
jgi:hypothetical protein